MNLGFIGLGIMGESMSENLLKAGEDLYVYDIEPSKVDLLVSKGAAACKGVAELGEKADIIFIMVPTAKHVAAVVEDLVPVLGKNKIVVDMSTIAPKESQVLGRFVTDTGAAFLDAPVVKSKQAAIEGKLGIYIGGEESVYNKVKKYLDYIGKEQIYLGKQSNGLVMKIAHNMLVAGIQNAVNEMFSLALEQGIDFDNIVEAISYGGGQNFYMDTKNKSIKEKSYDPKFSVQNMHKDINIAVELAEQSGLKLPGAEIARDVYEKAMAEELGGKDFSAVYEIVQDSSHKKP